MYPSYGLLFCASLTMRLSLVASLYTSIVSSFTLPSPQDLLSRRLIKSPANEPTGASPALIRILNGTSAYTGSQDEALSFVFKQLNPIPTVIAETDFLNIFRSKVDEITLWLNESLTNPENMTFEGTPLAGVTYPTMHNLVSAVLKETNNMSNTSAVLDLVRKLGMQTELSGLYGVIGPYLGFLARTAQLGAQEARKEKTLYKMLHTGLQTFFIGAPMSIAINRETTTPEGIFRLCGYNLLESFCPGNVGSAKAQGASRLAVKRTISNVEINPKHYDILSNLHRSHSITFRNVVAREEDWWITHVPLFGLSFMVLRAVEEPLKTLPANQRIAVLVQSALSLPWGLTFPLVDVGESRFCTMLTGLGNRCDELLRLIHASAGSENLQPVSRVLFR
jgi:hypothetical protein